MVETLALTERGDVLEVALNRPEVRNAFNARMIVELTEVFTEVASRDDLRAVVLRGNGRSFSAGADAAWMRAALDFDAEENFEDALRMSDMFAAIDAVPMPVIARVHGASLGGGLGLMAACDIVIAAEDTVFGFTEARLGIVPAVISRFVLPRIGPSWARALYLTAERFDAQTARTIGLVHWVVSPGDLDSAVEQRVDALRAAGPTAVREAKILIARAVGLDDDALRTLTARTIARVRTTAEAQDGLRAFLDKHPAPWVPESDG
jgi:methylglutaconyl-CoA hydratase